MKKTPAELLTISLKRKQKKNPQYSIRALARDIAVSPSYLNAVFSGKKPVPQKRLAALAQRLEIDDLRLSTLRKAMALEKLSAENKVILGAMNAGEARSQEFLEGFKEESSAQMQLWSQWYQVALLDLSTCKSFKPDPAFIAGRLGISFSQAQQAFKFLVSHGYLVEIDGQWQKADRLLRMPIKHSQQTIRDFHKQLMVRAVETMKTRTSAEDFERRLISGLTVAAAPSRVAEAKRRLNLCIHQIAEYLAEGDEGQRQDLDQPDGKLKDENQGDCEEVYQLGVQFFPLTHKD